MESKLIGHMRRIIIRALLCLGILGTAYIGSYWILMVRNCPAIDSNGNITFLSSFRGAPEITRFHGLTYMVGKVTVWNYLYSPLDHLYYSFRPSKMKIGEQFL